MSPVIACPCPSISPLWSDYRKSLPGDFIKIRLKIEQKCPLFLDIFSSAIMNDLFMTFISRLKVDAKCVYQQWHWITVVNYFGTPPADWVHAVFWAWRMDLNKGVPTLFAYCEKTDLDFFFKFNQGGTLGWPLLGIFSGFFFFLEGGLWGKSFIGNI